MDVVSQRLESQRPRSAGWGNQTIWLGHAAVTSATVHHAAERYARGGVGQAGVSLAPFNAWIDDWRFSSQSADPLADLQLSARDKDFGYQLHLTSTRPLVLQGDKGFSQKSEQGQASYYYSQPFFQASGSLEIDGKTYQVSGPAWLDREWSSQPLTANQTGWDWFSLHLDSGEQVMLYRMRNKDGEPYLTGTWIDAQGQTQPLHRRRHPPHPARHRQGRWPFDARALVNQNPRQTPRHHPQCPQPQRLDGFAHSVLGRAGATERQPCGAGLSGNDRLLSRNSRQIDVLLR